MPRYRTAYPPEFRRQMADLVRSGRTPEELAREFEPTAQSIATWVKQAERDAGKRIDGRRVLSGINWGAFDVRTIACVRCDPAWKSDPLMEGQSSTPIDNLDFLAAGRITALAFRRSLDLELPKSSQGNFVVACRHAHRASGCSEGFGSEEFRAAQRRLRELGRDKFLRP
jgi:hypothetical protein